MTGPFTPSKGGLFVRVRLTPNASIDQLVGIEPGPEDTELLKVKIRAVPEKGKANKALCAFLAKSLGLPKTLFEVISGSTSRLKTVLIKGQAGEIERKFREILARK